MSEGLSMSFSSKSSQREKPRLRETLFVPRFRLPPEGEPLGPYLTNRLKKSGIYRDGLQVRIISKERLDHALRTGTDRDDTSEIERYDGTYRGESLAMHENGLDPAKDAGKTTYVRELDSFFTFTAAKGDAVLIYAPEALKSIIPSDGSKTSVSNGFHMFKDKKNMKKSLLAVFS